MANKKIIKKQTPRRYDLGDFVIRNQQPINAGLAGVGALGAMTGDPVTSGITSGIGTGAALGTAIMPGIGTAIGAVGGALFGGIFGNKKKKAEKQARIRQEGLRRNLVYDQFESDINTVNENPYGVYEDGGLVTDPPKKVTLSKTEAAKRRNAIYAPIRDKINRVAMTNTTGIDPNIIDVMSVYDLNPGATGKNQFNTPLNNPPAMSKDIQDLQKTINNMSDKNLRGLLETDWRGISTREAVSKARAAGLGIGDIIKYGKFFKSLGKSGNTFADGGDVIPNIINIEKGELQIDPNNGKILRKYTGINPETGGLYEPHSKKGKDTINNMVTAKEGTFIITKKEANKYEDAIKNNDKLTQNTIMSNIRNKKQQMTKYADGGDINTFNPILDPMRLNYLNPNSAITGRPYTPLTINPLTNSNTKVNNLVNPNRKNNNFNIGNLFEYAPLVANAVQGLQKPDYLQYRNISPSVRNRQQVLNNLPTEVSVNPVLNNIYGNSSATRQSILNNTSNPAVARALIQANSAVTNNAINDAYYQNNNLNNSIKAQRAGIYSNLAQSQENINAQNAQMQLGVDTTNREMDLAKRQQFNYALSQLSQLSQAKASNKQKAKREQEAINILKEIFPNAGYLFDNYRGGLNG